MVKAKKIVRGKLVDKRTKKKQLSPGDVFTVRLPQDINSTTIDYLSTCDNRNKRIIEAIEFLFVRNNIDLSELEIINRNAAIESSATDEEIIVKKVTPRIYNDMNDVNSNHESIKDEIIGESKSDVIPIKNDAISKKKSKYDILMSQFIK